MMKTSTFFSPVYRIHTPRLVLRCWDPADAPLLKAAADESREHLRPWMPWADMEPEHLHTIVDRIRKWRSQFDLDQDYVFGIFDRDEKRVIGGSGLHKRVGPDAAEIGYWIHKDFINHGLATETGAALSRVAFEILNLQRVEIRCDLQNTTSAAIPQKLGFIHEATLRKRMPSGAGLSGDSMIWSLFAEDYPDSPAANIEIQAFDSQMNQIL